MTMLPFSVADIALNNSRPMMSLMPPAGKRHDGANRSGRIVVLRPGRAGQDQAESAALTTDAKAEQSLGDTHVGTPRLGWRRTAASEQRRV